MTPETDLILAIIRQAIRDYIRLDPDSDKVSAEFHIDEGHDFQTAESFLFNDAPIQFGKLNLTFTDLCRTLGIDQRRLKHRIARTVIEY